MKIKITSLTSLLIGSLSMSSAAFAEEKIAYNCPYSEGQIIEPKSALYVFRNVDPEALTKGEFETTSAYEARVEQSRRMSRLPFPVSVEARTYRNVFLEYDADKEVFNFNVDFAFSPHLYLEDAIHSALGSEAPRYFHAIHAYENGRFGPRKKLNDSKGQEFEAFRNYSQIAHIYDRSKEFKFDSLFITEGKNSVEIPVPLSQARQLKNKLKFAAIIHPKGRYTHWFEYEDNADFKDISYDSAIHYDLDFPIIIADILCLAVTDQKNEILKVVKAARPPQR